SHATPRSLVQIIGFVLGWVTIHLAGPYGAPEAVAQNIPVAVTGFLENEPEVAAHGDQLVGVWYSYSPIRTKWGYSTNGGMSWTLGPDLPYNPGTQGLVGQPSICVDDEGNFVIATVLGTTSGEALAAYRGTFQGASVVWQGPILATPILDSFHPYDAPRLVCDRQRGHCYLAYTRVRIPSTFTNFEHTIELVCSLDRGMTWSAPVALSGSLSTSARLAVGPEGELYVAWVDYAVGSVVGRKSLDFGASFGPEFTVGPIHDNWGTTPPGWDQNVVRAHPGTYFSCGAPNAPSLAVDRTLGPRRGALYAVWTDHVTGSLSPSSGTSVGQEPNGFFANAT
ncbi:MAG: hypothetical protein ACRD1T_27520, partial [Acidimicrobiia bacterium]